MNAPRCRSRIEAPPTRIGPCALSESTVRNRVAVGPPRVSSTRADPPIGMPAGPVTCSATRCSIGLEFGPNRACMASIDQPPRFTPRRPARVQRRTPTATSTGCPYRRAARGVQVDARPLECTLGDGARRRPLAAANSRPSFSGSLACSSLRPRPTGSSSAQLPAGGYAHPNPHGLYTAFTASGLAPLTTGPDHTERTPLDDRTLLV